MTSGPGSRPMRSPSAFICSKRPSRVEHGETLGHAVEDILALVPFRPQCRLGARRFHVGPGAFGHVLRALQVHRPPAERLFLLDHQDDAQPAGLDQRQCKKRAHAPTRVGLRVGRGPLVLCHVIDRHRGACPQGRDDLGAELIEPVDVAGRADDALVGPVAPDAEGPLGIVDLGIQDPRCAELMAQQVRGNGDDRVRVCQWPQHVGEFEPESLEGGVVLQFLFRHAPSLVGVSAFDRRPGSLRDVFGQCHFVVGPQMGGGAVQAKHRAQPAAS